jgi:hypothetical protein
MLTGRGDVVVCVLAANPLSMGGDIRAMEIIIASVFIVTPYVLLFIFSHFSRLLNFL